MICRETKSAYGQAKASHPTRAAIIIISILVREHLRFHSHSKNAAIIHENLASAKDLRIQFPCLLA